MAMMVRFISVFFLALMLQKGGGHETSDLIPTHFFVFGDRYTGVTYLSQLIKNNTNLVDCRPTKNNEGYTNADTSWRFGFFGSKELKQLGCDPKTTLFVMIVKDPYAWIASVAERKYPESSRLHEGHIDVIVHDRQNKQIPELNGLGKTRKKYNSLMEQRTAKIKAHRAILSSMQHSSLIRYEDLLEDMEQTLKKMLRGRGLTLRNKPPVDIAGKTNGHIDAITAGKSPKFSKRLFYTEKQYLSLFNSKTIKTVAKRLGEESTIGYHVLPNGPWENEQNSRNQGGIMHVIWRFMMRILWWTIIPTIVIIILSTPLIICLQKRSELNNDFHIGQLSKWIKTVDPSTGLAYFYHSDTREVRWNRPHKKEDAHSDIQTHSSKNDEKSYQHRANRRTLGNFRKVPFTEKEKSQ